ncbi:MAG: IS66 family insertion sequence element accessory protein TnpB [Natronospirillum sp.]
MSNTERARYWEEQVVAWQASGVSGQAYCKDQGLVYHQFTYWRRKLLKIESPDVATDGAGFAKVTPAFRRGESTAVPDSELTLSLPGGIAIRGLHAGNVSLLGDILRQL